MIRPIQLDVKWAVENDLCLPKISLSNRDSNLVNWAAFSGQVEKS